MNINLSYIKSSLDNVAFLSLFISIIGYWSAITFKPQNIWRKSGFYSTFFSNIIITIILGWRWIENGYFPLSNLYESLLCLTWGATSALLILEKYTSLIFLGGVISPLGVLTMGFATLVLPEDMQKAAPLVPALKSNWLMMHVSIMMLSYATLIIGSLLSIAFLCLSWQKEIFLRGNSLGLTEINRHPKIQTKQHNMSLLESLDNLSYRTIGFGFPLLTIGIIAGAVWANEAWGSYWSWDPKETWALITWLVFAAYLHTRITRSWQGKRPAMLASLGFIIVWVCYLGVNFLGKGLHNYGWIIQ
nr:cytochrome c biogenesis protein [Cryptomonas borealis]